MNLQLNNLKKIYSFWFMSLVLFSLAFLQTTSFTNDSNPISAQAKIYIDLDRKLNFELSRIHSGIAKNYDVIQQIINDVKKINSQLDYETWQQIINLSQDYQNLIDLYIRETAVLQNLKIYFPQITQQLLNRDNLSEASKLTIQKYIQQLFLFEINDKESRFIELEESLEKLKILLPQTEEFETWRKYAYLAATQPRKEQRLYTLIINHSFRSQLHDFSENLNQNSYQYHKNIALLSFFVLVALGFWLFLPAMWIPKIATQSLKINEQKDQRIAELSQLVKNLENLIPQLLRLRDTREIFEKLIETFPNNIHAIGLYPSDQFQPIELITNAQWSGEKVQKVLQEKIFSHSQSQGQEPLIEKITELQVVFWQKISMSNQHLLIILDCQDKDSTEKLIPIFSYNLINIYLRITQSNGDFSGEQEWLSKIDQFFHTTSHSVLETEKILNKLKEFTQIFHFDQVVLFEIEKTVDYHIKIKHQTFINPLYISDECLKELNGIDPGSILHHSHHNANFESCHHLCQNDFIVIRLEGYAQNFFVLLIDQQNHLTDNPNETSQKKMVYRLIANWLAQAWQIELQIQHQSQYWKKDPLTQLGNRFALQQELDKLPNHLAATDKVALAYIDLDNFKLINDLQGHAAGDAVLMSISRLLEKTLDAEDHVYRIGGDEFVLLIFQKSTQGKYAQTIESKLAKVLENIQQLNQLLHLPTNLTASIGVDWYQSQLSSSDQVMHQADYAMYIAKEKGKNQIFFYDKNTIAELENIQHRQNAIYIAATQQAFELRYQPAFRWIDGHWQLDAVELLIRWRQENGELVDPGVLIPVLEKTGQIREVGQWMLKKACSTLNQAYELLGNDSLEAYINISPYEFASKTWAKDIENVLKTYAISADKIWYEIHESTLINSLELVTNKLLDLRRLGINLSIDHFGSGLNNLNYLKNLPAQRINVDIEFIRDIDDPSNFVIVSAMKDMADRLNLQLCAKGVEKPSQLERIQELHIAHAQGYLLGKPLSQNQWNAWLKEYYFHKKV